MPAVRRIPIWFQKARLHSQEESYDSQEESYDHLRGVEMKFLRLDSLLHSCLALFAVMFITAFVVDLANSAPAAGQILKAGVVGGGPGDTVWFDVTLDPRGASVAATLHTISFDHDDTPIVACEKASTLDKDFELRFLPPSCGEVGHPVCNQIRVILWNGPTERPRAILTSQVLYRCQVNIPSTAVPGTYPLILSQASASDPPAGAKPFILSNGAVIVNTSGPGPGPGPGPGC